MSWDEIHRTSDTFWRAGRVPASSEPLTLEMLQRTWDELANVPPERPTLLLMSHETWKAAGKWGQHQYAVHMAALCTASRPIFGDILSPVPDWRRAAEWMLGNGAWPVDRPTWSLGGE